MNSPWLENKKWAQNQIRSSSKYLMFFYWGFAFFWNAISYTVLIPNLQLIEQVQEKPEILIFFLFPVIGLYIVFLAIKETREWRRFGLTPLSLDPFPGAIGGHLGGTLEFGVPYDPRLNVEVVVSCVYSYETGSGKDRSRREKIVWQSEGFCHIQPGITGCRLTFRFDVPEDLPESDVKKGNHYHLWRCVIRAELEGPDFDRSFEIPVFKTGQSAQLISESTSDHHLVIEDAEKGIEEIAQIKNIAGGVEAFFPSFQRPSFGMSLVLTGTILIGVAIATSYAEAPLLFPILFGAFGGVVFFGGIFNLFKSMKISFINDEIIFQRFLFGSAIKTIRLKKSDIKSLNIHKVGSIHSGKKTKVIYQLVGEYDLGKKIVLAERLNKRSEAERLREFFQIYLPDK